MSDLELIKGIGEKTEQHLNKLGIYNAENLLQHYPFRYELLKRSDPFILNQGDKIIIDGYIDSMPIVNCYKRNMNKVSFNLRTDKLVVNVIIYNRAFLTSNLSLNKVVTIIGKWNKIKNSIIASDILFEALSDEVKIEPIYRTTSGLNKKKLRQYIMKAVALYKDNLKDYIPNFLIDTYAFIDKPLALTTIHQPTDEKLLRKALLRYKYEELFMFMLKIQHLKITNKEIINGYEQSFDQHLIDKFINSLPFELTTDQIKVVDEILNDIKSPRRMNRLLQGDVGSGKTIVVVIAIYAMYLANYQSALMVPTEILAKQHYHNIKGIYKGYDIKVELLIGSLTNKEKEIIYTKLKKGKIDLIIGTHALIQEKVEYHNLGLVVTDEQHRFGVNQRSNLKNKGKMPDVIYMSATPIPRTYALTIYGDMDISSIKTIPVGRKEIITYLKKSKDIKEILILIKRELDLGHQVYVVAPLIGESDKLELENVDKLKTQFQLAFGKLYTVGTLHGKLNNEEKEITMKRFLDKEIRILISTTIIEIGIDVGNATMMIIFDASRFGLSTIHQLRGRVGRSNLQSYCILISDNEKERLKIMTTTNDGFVISEADFRLRGQGDLFGSKQSGDMAFKIADLRKDFKILLKAKEDAKYFLEHNMIDSYSHIKEELQSNINLN